MACVIVFVFSYRSADECINVFSVVRSVNPVLGAEALIVSQRIHTLMCILNACMLDIITQTCKIFSSFDKDVESEVVLQYRISCRLETSCWQSQELLEKLLFGRHGLVNG